MRLEVRCPECTLHGIWESFKRDGEGESLKTCPSCGSEEVRVEEDLGEFDVEVLSDEEVAA